MNWTCEPVKHLIESSYKFKNGRKYTRLDEYDSTKNKASIPVTLSRDDEKVVVRAITLEHFKIHIEENYSIGVVKELFVGIRNGEDIQYIGKYWNSKQFSDLNISQYFFKKNLPKSFNFGYFSGPGWPTNLGPVLDERLLNYFDKLKSIKPESSRNLDRCLELLSKPGPEYKPDLSEGISVKLIK